jgi:hypothetical protein
MCGIPESPENLVWILCNLQSFRTKLTKSPKITDQLLIGIYSFDSFLIYFSFYVVSLSQMRVKRDTSAQEGQRRTKARHECPAPRYREVNTEEEEQEIEKESDSGAEDFVLSKRGRERA